MVTLRCTRKLLGPGGRLRQGGDHAPTVLVAYTTPESIGLRRVAHAVQDDVGIGLAG